jgi:hypothetical protein
LGLDTDVGVAGGRRQHEGNTDMATVVISAYKVSSYLEGGGHFWVYMQYALGFKQMGCEVYWLEGFRSQGDPELDVTRIAGFTKRMEQFGLGGKVILYHDRGKGDDSPALPEFIGISRSEVEAIFHQADLLLNFHYAISPSLLACFRRTALIDIDPGLLQLWISSGQLKVAPHEVYFTTGDTVGTPTAPFPDCGVTWRHIHPPVCLERWPFTFDPGCKVFTTVSSWWSHDWVKDGDGHLFDNNKRVSFMGFLDLPQRTSQPLELALCLGNKPHDFADRQMLERCGWRVRHAFDVSRTPAMYQSYVQKSRGEFSCAKPTCMKFHGGWVSDRTLCYLASGKPVVVQHTGPSSILPKGEGMFRFSTIEEAVGAFDAINADYERHCRAAREIAEAHFDSKQVVERILNLALCRSELDNNDLLPNPVEDKVAGVSETHER